MKTDKPIAPMLIIRRVGRQRWHLWDYHGDDGETAFCGQTMRYPERDTAYNAAQITCEGCLVEAIRRRA